LQRAYDYTLNGQKALQQNLAATLAQVNLHQPQASPFLTKAVSVHGDSTQAPLKGRQLAAYHVLEDWVKLAAKDHPASNEAATAPPVTTDTRPVALTTPVATPPSAVAETPALPATPQPIQPAPAAQPAPPVAGPAQDTYDPTDFNRANHPEKTAAPAPAKPPPAPSR
jgi:hypothetical protein